MFYSSLFKLWMQSFHSERNICIVLVEHTCAAKPRVNSLACWRFLMFAAVGEFWPKSLNYLENIPCHPDSVSLFAASSQPQLLHTCLGTLLEGNGKFVILAPGLKFDACFTRDERASFSSLVKTFQSSMLLREALYELKLTVHKSFMTQSVKSGQNLITVPHHYMAHKHRRSSMKMGVAVARRNSFAVVAWIGVCLYETQLICLEGKSPASLTDVNGLGLGK